MPNKYLGLPAIVIVSNAVSGGGAEKSMMALHQSFLKNGLKTNLIALNQSINFSPTPFVNELGRLWKSGIANTWSNYLDFRHLIKSINPGIMIINCELPELYTAMIRTKSQIFCVEHTTKPWKGKKFLGLLVRLLLKFKNVGWVTVVSTQNKVWPGEKILEYIPNPYIQQSSVNRNYNSNKSLVFVGSLKSNKHPEWVIKAGLSLNLAVQIYGDGELRTKLENQYREYFENDIFFGFHPNPWSVISPESLIIVPTEYEGDGLVVVEAALSGNPLLLRDNKDLRRFAFEDKHYFKNLEDLIVAVSQNLESGFKNLVVSQPKIQEIQKNRSLHIITNRWINLMLARNSLM